MSTIKILVPKLLSSGNIYIKGYIEKPNKSHVTIYITKFSENLLGETEKDPENVIYGFIGSDSHKVNILSVSVANVIHFDQNTNIKKLTIKNQEINTRNCIIVIYDYNDFKNSQAVTNNDCYSKLVNLIQKKHESLLNNNSIPSFTTPPCLHSSMFLQHAYNYWNIIKWLNPISNRTKKLSMSRRSLMLAVLLDFILGYVVLQLLPQDTATIASKLVEVLQELINLLKSLLEWLMGSPVGLKLNKALNVMFGNFFTYHVQLWKLFVDLSTERLDALVNVYWCIGYLGITFQIAFISDWICLVTFHVYCFYGYVARLYNIQISALTALSRLFVGRKYNPLKCLNDSCEYTKEELFVGTLAFTIMLLLLPTTIVYYIVFTGFRVVSLMVHNVLAKLIYLVLTLPLYVMCLWVTRSPKLRGKFVIEVIKPKYHATRKVHFSIDSEDKVIDAPKPTVPLVLRIKLVNKPILELIKLFKPPVVSPTQVEWTNLLSNIMYGKQII